MFLKPYQLAIAIVFFLTCFSPEVSSRRIIPSYRRNATHYSNPHAAGWNYTSHNISYQNHHLAKPAYNSGPNLIYGNNTGNYSLHGGYRPHNTSFPTFYPVKYDYMPNPIHGNHTGNYSLHGGDHPHNNISFPTYYPANPANPIHGNHTGNYSLPHNSTNIFARLFKLW